MLTSSSFRSQVSTTKAQIRYHPPEVLEAFDSLAVAREELTAACNRAWDAFLADFAEASAP